jgi:hypothetical protein
MKVLIVCLILALALPTLASEPVFLKLNQNGFKLENDIVLTGDYVANALSFSIPADVDMVVIDLNGHSIVSAVRPPAYSYAGGINLACGSDQTKVIIRNGKIQNFDAGIACVGGQVFLENLTLLDNRVPFSINAAVVSVTASLMPAVVELHNGAQVVKW